MEVTILGTGAACPGPGEACSGFLVREDGSSLLVDCGTGIVGVLQKHVQLESVANIVISHMHADHFFDLIPYRYALRYWIKSATKGRPRLHLPPGGIKQITEVVSVFAETDRFFFEVFDISEYDAKVPLRAGPLTLTFAAAKHYIPTHSISLASDTRVVYSSDTGLCPEVERLAHCADLLICNIGAPPGANRHETWGHLYPHDAGLLAERSGVKRLLLSHAWPGDPHKYVSEARRGYTGSIEMAVSGRTYIP